MELQTVEIPRLHFRTVKSEFSRWFWLHGFFCCCYRWLVGFFDFFKNQTFTGDNGQPTQQITVVMLRMVPEGMAHKLYTIWDNSFRWLFTILSRPVRRGSIHSRCSVHTHEMSPDSTDVFYSTSSVWTLSALGPFLLTGTSCCIA
jgi:hypothetical protein